MTASASYDACSGILNLLKWVDIFGGQTRKKRVAVVDMGDNQCRDQLNGGRTEEEFTDLCNLT